MYERRFYLLHQKGPTHLEGCLGGQFEETKLRESAMRAELC